MILHVTVVHATVVHVIVVHVIVDTESTYDWNIVLTSIRENPVQHGIKMLDGFTKLCSNYRNG